MREDVTLDSLQRRGKGRLPGLIGLSIVAAEHELVVAELVLREELLAPNGFLHAATVVALAEPPAATAAWRTCRRARRTSPRSFLLSVEADRLIPLIFGPHYQEAVWLQKILVFVIPFSLLHSLAQIILVSLGLERLLLAIFLAALGFNLTLGYFIFPFRPLLGAAVAILLTKVGVACLIISYTHRRLGLLSRQDLPRLALAALAVLALYLGARPFLPRELAELAALAPLLGLGWWWKAGGGPGT